MTHVPRFFFHQDSARCFESGGEVPSHERVPCRAISYSCCCRLRRFSAYLLEHGSGFLGQISSRVHTGYWDRGIRRSCRRSSPRTQDRDSKLHSTTVDTCLGLPGRSHYKIVHPGNVETNCKMSYVVADPCFWEFAFTSLTIEASH